MNPVVWGLLLAIVPVLLLCLVAFLVDPYAALWIVVASAVAGLLAMVAAYGLLTAGVL